MSIGRLAYPSALVIGVVFVLSLFPLGSLWPLAPLHVALVGDDAVSAIGQRYFLAAPLGWPPLDVKQLAAPDGTNIGLTDSIPLAMLVLKPFRSFLPPGFFIGPLWVGLVWVLQPIAAVYALRGAGECRLVPAIAIAVFAVSMPTLLSRYGHMALCTHAAILAALGIYFRVVTQPRRRTWALASILLAACLLIHPYILGLTTLVLAAAPLTLLVRRDRRWRVAASWLAVAIVLLASAALLLGFGGTQPAEGFGYYSMNGLAPVLPGRSSLMPDFSVDATGGQFDEGFQYLGAGLLLLLALVVMPALLGASRLRRRWQRHAGLGLVLAGMAIFAFSNRVFLGRLLLLDLGPVPELVAQFRATGRFFWPVAYATLVTAIVVTARALPPGIAAMALLLTASLQVADTADLRRGIYLKTLVGAAWQLDEPGLAVLFAAHDRLTLWPSFGCGAQTADAIVMDVMLLASQTTMRTNTMFSARTRAEAACDPAAILSSPLLAGELRVIRRTREAWLVPRAEEVCRRSAELTLCSLNATIFTTWPPLQAPLIPLEREVRFPAPSLADALGSGWSQASAEGVWSDHGSTSLIFRPPTSGPLKLTLGGSSIAPTASETQTIHITVNGSSPMTWHLLEFSPQHLEVDLPATPSGSIITIGLQIDRPVRPIDRGMNDDDRTLGFYLTSLRLDPR